MNGARRRPGGAGRCSVTDPAPELAFYVVLFDELLQVAGIGEALGDDCQQVDTSWHDKYLAQGPHLLGGEPAFELVLAATEEVLDPGSEVMATYREATVLGEGDGPPHRAASILGIYQDHRPGQLLGFIHRSSLDPSGDLTAIRRRGNRDWCQLSKSIAQMLEVVFTAMRSTLGVLSGVFLVIRTNSWL